MRSLGDETLKIGETTSMEAMKYFVEGVIAVFGERYLRRPTMEDAVYSRLERDEIFLVCLAVLIVCIGNGRDVQLHGRANSLGVIRKSRR